MPAISDDDTGRMSDAESNASELSVKKKMSPSMTSPKESSSRNPSGSNIVLRQREKQKKKDTTQQDDSAEVLKLINAFRKSQQFSQKK